MSKLTLLLSIGFLLALASTAVLAIVNYQNVSKANSYLEQRNEAQAELRSAIGDLSATKSELSTYKNRESDLAARETAAADLETQLAERETAVKGAEVEKAKNTIVGGTWTVGRDIEPGTYIPEKPITSDACYWAITVSGTNGGDILQNDFAGTGRPTVTLAEGQDFTSERCGTWVKQ